MEKKYYWADKPHQITFPIASAGYPLIFGSAFITIVFALLELKCLALLMLVITLFICAFFRDPDRMTPDEENAITSPADGKVIFVGQVQDDRFIKGPCQKISVFMSIFNVHVNRIPCNSTVSDIIYEPGAFLAASKEKASFKNEYNALILNCNQGKQMCVVQIAGLIARRIICTVKPGDQVKKGGRFGLICFGSRLDLYLPVESQILVKPGEKVLAGSTIMALLSGHSIKK